ncbi:MAG: hypothetical protein KME16_02160 [Scytolyngbya sp. HA4215-MV1]|jgi:hypothetical protein|nr:hypothetical protein [Scytolyngbya sp. HA4215-MV1]
MNPSLQTSQEKKKGFIKNSNLTLLAFSAAFFPRILTALKIPSAINFLHFLLIPLACYFTLVKSRSKDPKQLANSSRMVVGLYILLTICFASALLNDAGIINAILSFLLLGEPFILLLTIVSLPLTEEGFVHLRTWFYRFALINLSFAYIQKYIFKMDTFQGLEDNIKGVFIAQGAGHVLGSSVSMTFGIYYLVSAKTKPLWLRALMMLFIFNHVIISDTKQVLLSFITAYVLLYLTNIKNPVKTLLYLIAAAVFLALFLWAAYNIPALGAYATWIRPEIYGPDGEATKLKLAAFRLVPQFFHSPLNWFLGLGPGHTVGRLGGWMLWDPGYWKLLEPLGATRFQASIAVWQAIGASWLGNQSSMFSPLFGWAGIWGDLGYLGLGTYFYLGFLVWQYIAPGNLTRYLILTVFAFGCVFSQLEEPGYMLFVSGLIGLQWHEERFSSEVP